MASLAASTAAASLGVSEIRGNPLGFSGASRAAPSASSPVTFKTVALFQKKKPAPAPKAKPAAVTPATDELAKWYGPERRIFLPEGLLDRSEIPEYLNGEVAGDYGYDPFGLGKKPEDFAKYQAYELIHARWAMLGAAGCIIPEAFNKYGANCGPEAVWFKDLEDKLHPGGPFDPLGLAKDPDQFALLKVKEIKNGPERRIFLPEGLLDRSEIPEYLNGEVAGEYQAYELIHARWAMLGAAGCIIPEAFNKYGANCGPEAVWFKTGALLLDGNTLNYFGKNIPINLVLAVVAEVVLVGGAEYYRIINGLDLEDRLHPGGPFDPLGLAKDPDQFALLKVKEIKNGRLAMFSMFAFFIQAYVTGQGPVENLASHLSDPFGNNLLTVISGNIERVPTL
ncbi:putative chlorophyll A-B binding protein [Helianthus annuus]|nr:putative chlorophyll A-B binding protein [Helianthus annuus]